MCLLLMDEHWKSSLSSDDTPKPPMLIADKDITCYRVVSDVDLLKHLPRPTVFTDGFLIKIMNMDHKWAAMDGIKSFASLSMAIEVSAEWGNVVECIIPKGTPYVKGVHIMADKPGYMSAALITIKLVVLPLGLTDKLHDLPFLN